MTNEEALNKAVQLYGCKAAITFDPNTPAKPGEFYEIYRSPEGFKEWWNSFDLGVLIGTGKNWEDAFFEATNK